jgi:CO dehydrogenase/acetyl-CoA synthase delta subunit
MISGLPPCASRQGLEQEMEQRPHSSRTAVKNYEIVQASVGHVSTATQIQDTAS